MTKGFVVLLHGILRSKLDMEPLSLFLQENGYDTANLLYPSRSMTLEDSTIVVAQKIHTHPQYSEKKPLHFVTHSMGSLLARYYIALNKPKNLGKVVMLSPPNTGSEMADYLNDNKFLGPLYRGLFGPASQQLITSYKHRYEDVDYPVGIIAGNRSINPLALLALKDEHDGIVPVHRTKIKGMADHITMPVNHTFMMMQKPVMKQVLNFLENGQFEREAEKASKPLHQNLGQAQG